MYENAEASLYHLLGNYETFLEKLYQMYEKNPDNMIVMDLAFAEARYGDPDKALSLIEDVNSNALPSYGAGIYDWTLGVIAYRQKRFEDAKGHFVVMMKKFDPYVNNPIIWEMIAVAAGTYADLLYDMGQKEEGVQLLQPGTVKILNLTADDILRKRLAEKYPEYISKECYCIREKY
jgi:tetratricopeptide (TPR) repeat protein